MPLRAAGLVGFAGFVGLVGLAVLCRLGLPGSAAAHDVRFGRLVHLRVQGEIVEVAMVVSLHAGPDALRVRDRFDADGDGTLGEPEQSALRAWFSQEAARDFALWIDGWQVGFEGEPGVLDLRGDPGVAAGEELAFRGVWRSALVLRPGRRELVVHDAPGNAREEIAVRVDLPRDITRSEARHATLVPEGARTVQVLMAGGAGDVVLVME